MTKKLYFLDVSSLNDEETHTSLSNEEFKKRAEIVYDSIDSFIDDFNREMCPSDNVYFCRMI
jgi:hypothetical protein